MQSGSTGRAGKLCAGLSITNAPGHGSGFSYNSSFAQPGVETPPPSRSPGASLCAGELRLEFGHPRLGGKLFALDTDPLLRHATFPVHRHLRFAQRCSNCIHGAARHGRVRTIKGDQRSTCLHTITGSYVDATRRVR